MTIALKSRTVALTAGALFAGIVLSGTATAITDTVFQYSTPQTGLLSIAPAAFGPRKNTNVFDNTGSSLQPKGDSTNPGANITTCYSAPINLPHGANLKTLTVWYAREDGSLATTITLWRHKFATGLNEMLVNKTLPITSGTATFVNYPVPTAVRAVDNQHSYYYLSYCGDRLLNTLYGARLVYTYTTAGD